MAEGSKRTHQSNGARRDSARPTAVVYCEGNFGDLDGKTANGLVRHSERFEIVSVIDSRFAGRDAGELLGDGHNGIAVVADLADAVARNGATPDVMVFGIAPASGMLSDEERTVLLGAMEQGMGIVNGLHDFLNDDIEFAAASAAYGVSIEDVRRPPAKRDLRMFRNLIDDVACVRLAVLGTDGAIGKRTTATILTKALNDNGIPTVLISTGQTGLIQGGRYGVALDAIPSQFCSGEVEAAVVEAYAAEHPAVIVVEGQGALSHPAYLSSTFILRGSRPDGVILQHAPRRAFLSDFPTVPMPDAASEIRLIESFADTKVVGLTINHENMTDDEVAAAIDSYGAQLGIPVTDALIQHPEHLVKMVLAAFPDLRRTRLSLVP
ncbi:MAG: DUF1611 domain-containing protein [Microthrixaceae bacterium]|jgi:uncharacterized NAD-dependent epimerase/dehydratase family protein|nr:DUF1611 domain-containing protein [Actinomycetota bacterium]